MWRMEGNVVLVESLSKGLKWPSIGGNVCAGLGTYD
jgi:hypothetical protein